MLINMAICREYRRIRRELCRVSLDGEDISRLAIEADDQQGYVVCLVLEEKQPENYPKVIRYKPEHGKPVTETKRGRVSISFESFAEKAA